MPSWAESGLAGGMLDSQCSLVQSALAMDLSSSSLTTSSFLLGGFTGPASLALYVRPRSPGTHFGEHLPFMGSPSTEAYFSTSQLVVNLSSLNRFTESFWFRLLVVAQVHLALLSDS